MNATISLEQSWCCVREGNTIDAFSCITRKWTRLTTVGPHSIQVLNDAFVVQDAPGFLGTTFYGYGPRQGRFVAQHTWSPSATLVPRISPQTWFAIVTDGNLIHVFQAAAGVWTTAKLAGAPTVTMGTKCALVDDGTNVYGVSAWYGTPVPLMCSTQASVVGAYGNVGIAQAGNELYGFSAYKNTWAAHTLKGSPTVKAGNTQAAFVSVEDSGSTTSVAFFSGHTGSFTVQAVTPLYKLELERAVALVVDTGRTIGYSGLTGKVDQVTVMAPTTVMQQFYALVDDGTSVHAFSATKAKFAQPLKASSADITTRSEMAVHQPASASVAAAAYSQYRNEWMAPPASVTAATTYVLAGMVVLEEPSGGLHGLSLRSHDWVYQATPKLDTVHVGSSRPNMEMTLVAQAGTQLWAFNSRLSVWRKATTSAPATAFKGNNTALFLEDGSNAYGFSSWTDKWSKIALAGPIVSSSAQVQSCYVYDGTRVHAFSGIGQLSTTHEYPEYWRVASLGARMRLDIAGEPDSLAVLLASPISGNLPIPGLGDLWLNPLFMFVLATPTLSGDGLFDLTLQIPDDPGLSGVDLHFQAAIFPSGAPYLTNSASVRML